ncbi:uncharacterized protein LOC110176355 [Drosophila serrata]|uniref:uncharacterized protein LOC110176355 n=1 Tax=Drosophila serrata TaxID=7274 RepID=UPI000A1D2EEE|nr:uncharacterized protein LOC110176355 [Drosophila serrata]
MKLTILFIVMQLLTLQVIRANDLWQDQLQKEQVEGEQRQGVALHQEVVHPWRTPCMQQCVKDMVPATDRSAECQRYERAFDCSLYCVFEVPIY